MFFKYIKDGITVSVVLDRRTLNKDGKYPVRIKVYQAQVENPEELKAKNHDVYTRINKRMKTVCEALGIERITTYSARHSFASVMNSEGVPVSYISEQLGHTSIRTTQAYLAGFSRDARAQNAKILTSFLSTLGK